MPNMYFSNVVCNVQDVVFLKVQGAKKYVESTRILDTLRILPAHQQKGRNINTQKVGKLLG